MCANVKYQTDIRTLDKIQKALRRADTQAGTLCAEKRDPQADQCEEQVVYSRPHCKACIFLFGEQRQ